jgi:hypothetical protein
MTAESVLMIIHNKKYKNKTLLTLKPLKLERPRLNAPQARAKRPKQIKLFGKVSVNWLGSSSRSINKIGMYIFIGERDQDSYK